MTTTPDFRLGRFLSAQGVIHASRMCARLGRAALSLDTEDVAYFDAEGTTHEACKHCMPATLKAGA